jgi:hypothetical protein
MLDRTCWAISPATSLWHRNDAVELAIELIVPNVTLVENPNQLGGNPHVCGIAPHASPEYIVRVQITAISAMVRFRA